MPFDTGTKNSLSPRPHRESLSAGDKDFNNVIVPTSPLVNRRLSAIENTVRRLSLSVGSEQASKLESPLNHSSSVDNSAETSKPEDSQQNNTKPPKENNHSDYRSVATLEEYAKTHQVPFTPFQPNGIDFLLKDIPNMPNEVRTALWSYMCSCEHYYLEPIIQILKSGLYSVFKLTPSSWEEVIVCCVKTSYKGLPERLNLPSNILQSERQSEDILQLLLKLVPNDLPGDLDPWEAGCVLASQLGCGRVLRILYDEEKVKIGAAYLLRGAADNGHWHLVGYIMGEVGFSDQQQQLMSMYRSLYMLQQGAKVKNWQIVDKVIDTWRADTNSTFESKWTIATEMACDRANPNLLNKLFAIRTEKEEDAFVVTVKMLALGLASGSAPKIVPLLLELNNSLNIDSMLFGLPSEPSELHVELLIRTCNSGESEILSQIYPNGGGTLEEAANFVADMVEFILQEKLIDTKKPEVQSALRSIFMDGNIRVGQVLLDNGIQFNWMEPDMAKSSNQASSSSETEVRNERVSKPIEENEYTAIMAGVGITDNLISFKDFEAILAKAVDVIDVGGNSGGEDVLGEPMKPIPRKNNQRIRAKSIVKVAAPRLLIDPEDQVWTSFLNGIGMEDSDVDEIIRRSVAGEAPPNFTQERKASWMEPNCYTNSLAETSLDPYEVSEWDQTSPTASQNMLFVGYGGGRRASEIVE